MFQSIYRAAKYAWLSISLRDRQILLYIIVIIFLIFTVPTFTGEFRTSPKNLSKTVTSEHMDPLVRENSEGVNKPTTLKEIEKTPNLHVRSLSSIKVSNIGPFHHFWPKEPQCSNFSTRFAVKNSIPLRALASYPGSGNTWIRYLIEAATGIYTGSIFKDKSIIKAGHHGEARNFKDGSTILQKTHHRAIYIERYAHYGVNWRTRHIRDFGGRGVVVIRNPYKAILSYWNFKNTQSHTKTISAKTFHSREFRDFVVVGIERWLEVVSDWLNLSKDVYFIFYEDLADAPTAEIRKLLKYLRFEVNEGRLQCIELHSAGSFHRKHHQAEDPFTAENHFLINKSIERANNMLKEKIGRELPLEKYEFYTASKEEAS